jgi:hypothetical protein
MSVGILSRDTLVTVYKWSVTGIDEDKYSGESVAFDVKKNDNNRIYYLADQRGLRVMNDGHMRVSCFIGNKTEAPAIYLYVIGKPLESMPEWTFYRDGGVKDGEEIDGQTIYCGCETTTLYEFALSNHDAQGAVSELDWYNATVSEICYTKSDEYPVADMSSHLMRFEGSLISWYQYNITLEPGARLTNKVTAPLYPGVDMGYTPSKYFFRYLLSPASTWAGFGTLDIEINTSGFLLESTVDGFEKTEDGYRLSREGLPKDKKGNYLELELTVSSSENPEKVSKGEGLIVLFAIVMLIFSPIMYIIEGIEWLIDQIGSLFN